MRRSGYASGNGLFFLLTDHGVCASANTGSTAVQTTSNGTLSASVKYLPWGGERDSSGTMRTTFRFTGQRSEEESVGLYYYGARWYDSSLGRFISADTLIPNPGNVLDWDRYSYTRNNPVKYVDPTGHFCEMVGTNEICSADPDSNGHWLPQVNPLQLMKDLWGWSVQGDWLLEEIHSLQSAGFAIQSYVYRLGEDGQAWVRKYLGNTVFRRDLLSGIFFGLKLADGVMMFRNVIRLPGGFNLETVLHEIAHVFDNNFKGGILPATWFGGGPTDEYIRAMGGDPGGCLPRWYCPKTHYGNAGDYPWPIEDFVANHSAADDFAKTFAVTIINPASVPYARRIWMESFIYLSARNLR